MERLSNKSFSRTNTCKRAHQYHLQKYHLVSSALFDLLSPQIIMAEQQESL